jgi:hypothetical protein
LAIFSAAKTPNPLPGQLETYEKEFPAQQYFQIKFAHFLNLNLV